MKPMLKTEGEGRERIIEMENEMAEQLIPIKHVLQITWVDGTVTEEEFANVDHVTSALDRAYELTNNVQECSKLDVYVDISGVKERMTSWTRD